MKTVSPVTGYSNHALRLEKISARSIDESKIFNQQLQDPPLITVIF